VKKLVILFKLLLLTVLKKNHAKAEVIRKSIDNYLDTYNREGAKYKPLILNNIKTMKLLLESDRFHKEELKREVARLLWAINQ